MKRSKKSQRKTLAERKKEEPKKTMAEKCRIFWGRIPIASTVAAAIIVISLTVLLISAETGLIYMDEAFRMVSLHGSVKVYEQNLGQFAPDTSEKLKSFP